MPAPQFVLRSYGGGAVVAQLTEIMGATDTAFSITPTTGWVENDGSPLGTVGPFTVGADLFSNSVEKILCSSIDLDTGLVQVYVDPDDGWSGRGYDGSTAQGHAPGTSPGGFQTCWSAAEAAEANQVVFDFLGGGGGGAPISVPIGSSLPFNGTPLTIPSNFVLENGAALNRTTYSACFNAITIAATGTTTAGGTTISAVSSSITPYIEAGMKATVTACSIPGTIYTVASVTSTTVVLTSGTDITAETAGGFIVYPHGAGDGSTTFNVPDSRGRSKIGQGQLGTNTQPTVYVGQGGGVVTNSAAITTANIPAFSTADSGTAAIGALCAPSMNLGTIPTGDAVIAITSATASGRLTTSGSGQQIAFGSLDEIPVVVSFGQASPTAFGFSVESPYIGCTWMIRVL